MTKTSTKPHRRPAFFTGSLRRQLAWSFGCVSLVLMIGLASLLFQQQRSFLYHAALQQGQSLASSLASSSTSWVLANDLAGLNEVLQGFSQLPDLTRAYILSLQGEVLASTRTDESGLFIVDPQNLKLLKSTPQAQIMLANDQQIDIAVPILANQHHIGWARVEIAMNGVNKNLHEVVIRGAEFIGIAALMTITAAVLLAHRLTRRLRHLMFVVTEVESGNVNIRAQLSSHDEIGILAHDFNNMLNALSHSERLRERITHLYAAWTQSVDVIVREPDETKMLNEVCQIIASQMSLRLVWVGMTGPNNRVHPVAASHPDSPYLRHINISIDGNLPEGQGPMGSAIREGIPKIINHFLREPNTVLWQNTASAENIQASAAFPLTRGGQCIGAMAIYSTEVNYFNEDLINLLRGLADDLSYALDNIDRERMRIKAEHELRIAAAAFESQEGIMVTDAEQKILRINKSFTTLTGYQPSEVIGKSAGILKSGWQDSDFYKKMWECINQNKHWQGEIWNKRKDGQIYPEWLCITAITDLHGKITNYVGTFTDISQRKADEQRIRDLAYYDALTKLPNRTLLFDRLNIAFSSSSRNRTHGALMFLDLDNFKTLNDTLGHDYGDQLLIEAARRLQLCTREIDTVARLGGDEFVIMLEFLDEQEIEAAIHTHTVAEKIRSVLSEPYLLHANNQSLPIEHHSSCSIGFVLFLGHNHSCEELLKRADLAMYQAKHAGRNIIRAFVPEMQESLNQRTSLEADLRNAINLNELALHYQVQVDSMGRAIGAEALIRWYQPDRGMIPPNQFIHLAEETGLIIPIGQWILEQGCQTLVNWAKHPETSELNLSINISGRQLSQSDFVEQIQSCLQKTGANPARLKLEITESVVLDNVEATIDKMHAIKELGVNFSMDDFGTGYSSLSYLQKLPLEQLKIDQSFIRDIAFSKQDTTIVRTILALGKNLNLCVVAEGVETEAQFGHLINHGCLVFQGYLFGRPVPIELFEQQLTDKQNKELAQ